MGRPRRIAQAAVAECAAPPDELSGSQSVARVVKGEGRSMYTCALGSGKLVLVELPSRFHKAVWIRRGLYVVVDVVAAAAGRRENSRVVGEIVNVVGDERAWRKMAYWCVRVPRVRASLEGGGTVGSSADVGFVTRPKEFVPVRRDEDEDDDEDESTVGKMPPSDSESD